MANLAKSNPKGHFFLNRQSHTDNANKGQIFQRGIFLSRRELGAHTHGTNGCTHISCLEACMGASVRE